MALFVEAVGKDGVAQRAPIDGRKAQLNARPGLTYRIVDEQGATPAIAATVKRVGDDLVVDGLPGSSGIQINGFFTECSFEAPCMLSLKGLGGVGEETITPLTEPLAALADGAFILKAPQSLAPELPTAPESEFPFKPVLGGVGLLAVAGGGGGGGGASTPTAPIPTEPSITSKSLTNDPTPEISGVGVPGSTIRLTLEIPGYGPVSFSTQVDAGGHWTIDTGSAQPTGAAQMPAAGLPGDAITRVILVAQSSGGTSAPIEFQLTVDTTPPSAVATLDAINDDMQSITGAIPGGGTTNDPSPTLTGSISQALVDGELVRVLRNGTPVGSAIVNGTQWTYTDTGLADATGYSYTVQVEDAAGNASTPTAAQTLLTDFTAPGKPTIAVIAGDDRVNEAEGRASDPAPITVSGTADAGTTVNVVWGALTQSATAAGDGSWSVIFNGQQLADGSYGVTATAVDAAGNASPAETHNVIVLTGKPSAPSFLPVEGDNAVNAAEASDGIVLSGSTTAGTQVDITLNGVVRAATVTGTTWSLTIAQAALPADGSYIVTAQARDVAGNLSTVSSSPTITIDQTPPAQTVSINQADDNVALFVGAVGNNGLTNDQTPTIQGTVSGALGGGETVQVFRDGTLIGTSPSTSFSVTDPGLSTQGAHVYTARVVDAVGNTGPSSANFTLQFDNQAPGAPVIATVAGNNAIDATEAAAGVSITGTAEPGGSVSVVWGGTTLTGSVNGSGNWSVPFASGQIPGDGAYTIGVTARDAAGNSSNSASQPVSVDRTPPSVAITNSASGATNGPVTFTFTFSEPVTGFAASDITVANGSKGALTTVDASHYTMIVTPTVSSGAMTVDVAGGVANDAAGNGNTAATQSSVTIDQIQPTVAITDDAAGTASGPVTFTFTFSEAVTGFASNDITISGNGTKGAFNAVSATVYTLVVTPTPDTTGTLTVDVGAGAASDAAGNASVAPAQHTQAFDTVVPPSLTITDNIAAATTNGPVVFTFTFTEAVNGFTASDVGISAGTKGTFTGANGDTVYTLAVTPPVSSTGTITASVAAGVATDLIGNANLAATPHGQGFDTLEPTIVSITDTDPDVANGPVTFTFTFSEAVTGFTASDVSLSAGSKGAFTGADGASVYSLVVDPPAGPDGSYTVQVPANAAQDLAGNFNSAASSVVTQPYDTTHPSLTITDGTAGTATGPVTYSFAFSEAVSGFAIGDITVTNGTKSSFSGSGANYSVVVTPSAGSSGNIGVSVAADAANDTAGNGNTAASAAAQPYDTRTITITQLFDNDNGDLYVGAVPNGGTGDDETPTLTISLGGPLGGGESIHVFRGATDLGAAALVSGTTYQLTDNLTPGSIGAHTSYTYTAAIYNGGSLVTSGNWVYDYSNA